MNDRREENNAIRRLINSDLLFAAFAAGYFGFTAMTAFDNNDNPLLFMSSSQLCLTNCLSVVIHIRRLLSGQENRFSNMGVRTVTLSSLFLRGGELLFFGGRVPSFSYRLSQGIALMSIAVSYLNRINRPEGARPEGTERDFQIEEVNMPGNIQ